MLPITASFDPAVYAMQLINSYNFGLVVSADAVRALKVELSAVLADPNLHQVDKRKACMMLGSKIMLLDALLWIGRAENQTLHNVQMIAALCVALQPLIQVDFRRPDVWTTLYVTFARIAFVHNKELLRTCILNGATFYPNESFTEFHLQLTPAPTIVCVAPSAELVLASSASTSPADSASITLTPEMPPVKLEVSPQSTPSPAALPEFNFRTRAQSFAHIVPQIPPQHAVVRRRGNSDSDFDLAQLPEQLDLAAKIEIAVRSLDAGWLNELLRNPDAERLALKHLLAACKKAHSAEQALAFAQFVQELSITPLTALILLGNRSNSNAFKAIFAHKALAAPDDMFSAFDIVLDLKALVRNCKDTVVKSAIAEKLSSIPDDAKHFDALSYVVLGQPEHKHLLPEVLQSYAAKFASNSTPGTALRLPVQAQNARKQNYLHILLDSPDERRGEVFEALKQIFGESTDAALRDNFAAAVFFKDANGVTPLAMLAEKDDSWLLTVALVLSVCKLFVKQNLSRSAEAWDSMFADVADVFNNNDPNNSLIPLFMTENFARLNFVVDKRNMLRTAIYNVCYDVIREQRGCAITLAHLTALLGRNDYLDVTLGSGFPLLHGLVAVIESYATDDDQPDRAAKLGKQVELLALYGSLPFSQRVKDTFCFDHVFWHNIMLVCRDPAATEQEVKEAITRMVRQVKHFKLDVNLARDNIYLLAVAALDLHCLELVCALHVECGAQITGPLLLYAACDPRAIDAGIFAYLCTQYKVQKHSPRPLLEIKDSDGSDLFYLVVCSAQSPAGLRWLLASGYKPSNTYGPTKDNILMRTVQFTLANGIAAEAGVQLAQVLLEDPKRATTLLNQRNAQGFNALTFIFVVFAQIDPVFVCQLFTLLVDKGADLTATHQYNSNIVHLAATNASLPLVACLFRTLEAKLSPTEIKRLVHARSTQGETPQRIILRAQQPSAANTLLFKTREDLESKIRAFEAFAAQYPINDAGARVRPTA